MVFSNKSPLLATEAENSRENTMRPESWVFIIGGGLLPRVLIPRHFRPAIRRQSRLQEPVNALWQVNAGAVVEGRAVCRQWER